MVEKKFILLTLIIVTVNSYSQDKYCRLIDKKRPVNFYWDWHEEYEDTSLLRGVSRQMIFHVDINNKDSLLEREIFYDRKGRPIVDRRYAVPSEEGVIDTDSFFYDAKTGLLSRIKTHNLNCVLGYQDIEKHFFYDSLNRQILSSESGSDANTTYTLYESKRTIKSKCRYIPPEWLNDELVPAENDIPSRKEIHYYNQSGREDSMQVFVFGKWRYTSTFLYDTLTNARDIYITSPGTTWHRSRLVYNSNGKVNSLLIRYFPNWNHTRNLHVESKVEYNVDGTTKQCNFYIMGKKKFLKMHYYEYY